MKHTAFVSHVLDCLRGFGNVTARNMFGGAGLFRDGFMFGLIADDRLYFKVSDANKIDYQLAGSKPFIYDRHDRQGGKNIVALSYWELPADVLENDDALHNWAVKAHHAAVQTKEGKHAKLL